MAMQRTIGLVCASVCGLLACEAAAQNWVNFQEQGTARVNASSALVLNDTEEKDYVWGDLDQDGDIDLVIVRKQPFSTPGRRRNVLLMNEGGILFDRTAQYASAADDGGQGFLDETNDRDAVLVDVNGDGWLDVVTATTYGQGLPKTISHPRVYINLGESGGVWQGFRYEQARIPQFTLAPNFCAVAAGDLTGNKAPDLYFVDYRSTLEDKLLINDGNGFFTDETELRVPLSFRTSNFGSGSNIADMNGDGFLDIVKSENGPVKTAYNNGSGVFNTMQATYSGAAYFVNVGDLNSDGRMDLIVSDDGSDRYLLNQGNGPNGQATFLQQVFPSSGGFNGASRVADLNNDGRNDVIICDVDVDAPGCSRITKAYRNLGNLPNVTMADQAMGGLTGSQMVGIFDMAVFDINGDGWLDLVVGKCSGTQIWINIPPAGLTFDYPQGLPGFVEPNKLHPFQVTVQGIGAAIPQGGTGVLFTSVDGAPFTSAPMSHLGGNVYAASLPGAACADAVRWYVSAQSTQGETFFDPPGAPGATYSAIAAAGTEEIMNQNFEGDVSDWTVVNDPSLTGGGWVQAIPAGTISGGQIANPENDAGGGDDVKCFITGNGVTGEPASANDVDGGPTSLLSPTIDLAGTDATISYKRWFFCSSQGSADADVLRVEVSNNNGSTWTLVEQVSGTASQWLDANFRVGQYITPTGQVRVRFSTSDVPNNSVTEAGIDNFQVERLVCGPTSNPADLNGDGVVGPADLGIMLGAWGNPGCGGATPCAADLNGDGSVGPADLGILLGNWG